MLARSSNVGAARIALGLPREAMWDLYRRVGFGTAPELGFPGAAAGRLRHYKTWRPVEQATLGYGMGISLSLAQLARAYTVFARRGIVPLTLVKTGAAVSGEKVSAEAARAVRAMLEQAVQPSATGRAPASWDGGSRQDRHRPQAGERRLRPDKYLSSFVGLAPVSAPRLVVAVMIDEPSAGQHYGGAAAPVFARWRCACWPCRTTRRWWRPAKARKRRRARDVDVFRELAAQGAMIDRLSSDSRRCAPGVAFSPTRAKLRRPLHRRRRRARRRRGPLGEEGPDWRAEWRAQSPRRGLKQQASALAHEFYGRPRSALGLRRHRHQRQDFVQPVDRRALDKTAVIGTLGAGFPGALSAATNTTPDAVETQFLLKNFLDQAQRPAMEVSSHGFVQGRVSGVRFSCALLPTFRTTTSITTARWPTTPPRKRGCSKCRARKRGAEPR